jgi:hypothetical protein
VFQPRLLASLGSQRERFDSAASLQCYTGLAPVTKKSGGSCYIYRRYLCPKFHRQSFHEYAYRQNRRPEAADVAGDDWANALK